jgi:hypothetical protein
MLSTGRHCEQCGDRGEHTISGWATIGAVSVFRWIPVLRPAIDATQNWRCSLCNGVTCSVTKTQGLRHPISWVRSNLHVSKRHCTSRAEWRLQLESLRRVFLTLPARLRLRNRSHRRWEQGGIEPIYVCENHAKQLGPCRDHGQDARIITAQSDHNPIKREDRTQIQEVADIKPNGSASSEATRSGLFYNFLQSFAAA